MADRHRLPAPAARARTDRRVGAALATVVACLAAPASDGVVGIDAGVPAASARPASTAGLVERGSAAPASAGPEFVDGRVADTLVQVRGSGVCSGTRIAATNYVVTAAHCVLDRHGEPAPQRVVDDGVEYAATAVWVDVRYAGERGPRLDAAVLEFDRPLPGPAATLGSAVPVTAMLTIAGYQAIGSDGTLLRGEPAYDSSKSVPPAGGVITVESKPAGCTIAGREVAVSTDRLDVACGLVPGASGGGLYDVGEDGVVLVGIISTVSHDATANGLTPIRSVADLLAEPGRYRYPTDEMRATATLAAVTRS